MYYRNFLRKAPIIIDRFFQKHFITNSQFTRAQTPTPHINLIIDRFLASLRFTSRTSTHVSTYYLSSIQQSFANVRSIISTAQARNFLTLWSAKAAYYSPICQAHLAFHLMNGVYAIRSGGLWSFWIGGTFKNVKYLALYQFKNYSFLEGHSFYWWNQAVFVPPSLETLQPTWPFFGKSTIILYPRV